MKKGGWIVVLLVVMGVAASADAPQKWWVSYYNRFDSSREVLVYHSSNGKEVFCSEVSSSLDGYTTGIVKSVSCVELHEDK